ncbi:MAG: hypothetical protein IKB92_02180 [Clostridia bacterium]|nr:hypothetical protein [Clostridia bacterium]
MNKYIGVTIGPVFETINMAETLAALWASSYMFSLISKTVCETLVEKGVPKENIIAPYYNPDDLMLSKNDGIGLFHDRIVFVPGDFDIAQFDEVKNTVLEKTGQIMGIDSDYLKEYILLSAAEFEAENPLAESGRVLDCLELAAPYVFCEKKNPLMSLFVGSEDQEYSRNSAIKKIAADFENFQLRTEQATIKTIEDIVRTGTGKKKYRYYAIVRSDGDNTNRIIGNLDAVAQKSFSKDCLAHCAQIAKLVEEYSGVTIYSGGDDLLAILPCESRDGKGLFEFTRRANEMYMENFRKYNVQSTLSFGIAIAYYKYKLGESLDESAHLLFDVAKTRKNGVAISVRKNSGQTDSIFASNDCIGKIMDLQESAERPVKEGESFVFLSEASDIAKNAELFEQCTDKQSITNLFSNFFAATKNDFWNKHVSGIYADLQSGLEIRAITEDGIVEDRVQALVYLLRIIKFFTEKEADAA